MAESATDKPPGSGPPGKTLDALSREDLIKFSKKQAVNMSQMKAKIVDLQKIQNNLIAEKDELRAEVMRAADEASHLREENDCLNQKVETVTASYLAVVNEINPAGSASHEQCLKEKNKLKQESQKLEDLLSNVSLSLDEVEREKRNLSQSLSRGKASLEELQAQNVSLKASVERALDDDRKIEELRSELRAKSEEMTALRESLDQLDALKCKLDGEVSSWRNSFDECQLTIGTIRDENDELSAERDKTVDEVTRLNSEIARLNDDKSVLEEREVKLKTMAQKMKAELVRRREEEKNRSSNEGSLDRSIGSEVESKISVLEKELSERKDQLQIANDSLEAKAAETDRLTSETASLNEKIRALTTLKEDLSEKVSRLETNESSQASKIASLEEDVVNSKANLAMERDERKGELEEQRRLTEEAESRFAGELEQMSTELRELSLANLRLEEENQEFRNAADEEGRNLESEELRSARIDEMNSEIQGLQRRLEESDSTLRVEKMEKAQFEEKLAEMAKTEEEGSARARQFEDELEDCRRENAKLDEETRDLRRHLRERSEAMAEAVARDENFGAKVVELSALVAEKSGRIANLEEKMTADADAAKKRIEELNGGVEERDEKLDLIESEVQELQRENERLKTTAIEWKEERERLEAALRAREEDESATNEEREQFKATIIVKEETLRQRECEHAEKLAELNDVVKRLEEEAKAASGKLSASFKSLEEEKARHKQTYVKLENLKKNAQKKSVMHLEISDYEKTVDQLTRTIEERDKEKTELREEIRHREEKIEALISEKTNVEIQREEESQRAEMIKANWEKAKAELETARDADHARQMRQIEDERRVESLRREAEETKVAMADAAAVAKRNEDDLSRKLEGEQRAYKALQSKYELVEDELQHAQLEIVAVKEEMSNYKTKAQAVLKQAKSESLSKESTKLAKAETEKMTARTKELEAEVESLQNEIRETIDEADVVKADREELRRAHADVHRQLNAAEDRHRAAAKEWESENRTCKDHYESSVQSLTDRQTALVESHRDKLLAARQEFATQLATVQRVADSNEQEVFRLQKELQIALAVTSTDLHHHHHHQQQQQGGAHPNGGNGLPPQPLMSSSAVLEGENGGLLRGAAFISSIERQEGEGMEHTDTSECGSPSPSQTGAHQPFVSFDQLLSSSNVSTIDSVTTPLPSQKHVWPTEEVTLKTLHEELSTASRKVAHLTELLRESEASNARLAEESKMLKEEIRRTERNSHRQVELDNLEYLKNVIFKFLSFESDAEARTRLIPVMTMLLKLSPEEKQMLTSVAAGDEPAAGAVTQANAAEGGGWSAYLHRWSGLM